MRYKFFCEDETQHQPDKDGHVRFTLEDFLSRAEIGTILDAQCPCESTNPKCVLCKGTGSLMDPLEIHLNALEARTTDRERHLCGCLTPADCLDCGGKGWTEKDVVAPAIPHRRIPFYVARIRITENGPRYQGFVVPSADQPRGRRLRMIDGMELLDEGEHGKAARLGAKCSCSRGDK